MRDKTRRNGDTVLTHIDVHRACSNAPVDTGIFVELPPGDDDQGAPKQCCKLAKAMYGKRHAAVAWQAEVQKAMREIGMHAGAYSHCAPRRIGGSGSTWPRR